jgi:hypothetical protein
MSVSGFDPMAKDFVPHVTIATSLRPVQHANEFIPRQRASYSGAFDTPEVSLALRSEHRFVKTSSMSDNTRQSTAPPNMSSLDVVASICEEAQSTSEQFETVDLGNLDAFHRPSTSDADLTLPLAPRSTIETAISAATKLVRARTPELLPHTPMNLPSKFGRAAQPARADGLKKSAAHIEEERQEHMIDMADVTDLTFHHINWCGRAIFLKTRTPPAVSLCVIAATPKKEYFDFDINLCTSVLLRNAFHFVDPILLNSDLNLFYGRSGTELQNAVIGLCHKFYNERPRWHSDDYEADEDIPVCDTKVINDYDTKDTIFNGRDVPVRSDLLFYSARYAEEYHAARKPRMEQSACETGEAVQERVMRQPFVKSPLRKVLHCSEVHRIFFGTTVTAAAAARMQQSKCKPRSPPGGSKVTPVPLSMPKAATMSGPSAKWVAKQGSLELPSVPELQAAPEGIACQERIKGVIDDINVRRKKLNLALESITASRAYFDATSDSNAAIQPASVSVFTAPDDDTITSLGHARPARLALRLTTQPGTEDASLSARPVTEAIIHNCALETSSSPSETQQHVENGSTAATLSLDCTFAADYNLPPLVEPRSPLPTFKRTRPSTRQASWASFRNNIKKVSSSKKDRDRPLSGLERRVKTIKDFLRRKQNILR